MRLILFSIVCDFDLVSSGGIHIFVVGGYSSVSGVASSDEGGKLILVMLYIVERNLQILTI
jgi:hypothetical protein